MNIKLITNALGPSLYGSHLPVSKISNDSKIIMITNEHLSAAQLDSSDIVYICQARHLKRLLNKPLCGDSAMFICSGYIDMCKDTLLVENTNLLFSTLDLCKLYNTVSSCLYHYQRGLRIVQSTIYKRCSVHEVLSVVAEVLGASVFLTDRSFQVFERASKETTIPMSQLSKKIWPELTENAYITQETRLELNIDIFNEAENDLYFVKIKSKGTGTDFGYLLLFFGLCIQSEAFQFELAKEVCSITVDYLLESGFFKHGNTSVDHLIFDLIERRIESEQQVRERIENVGVGFPDIYYCVVIAFESKIFPTSSAHLITESLIHIFPKSISTIYDERIIIIGSEKRPMLLNYDYQALEQLLKYYNAHAGISYRSRFYLSLSVLYREALSAIRFGCIFSADKIKRSYFFEDYHQYLIIELCTHNVHTPYHNGNPLYLCSPYLLKIKRHDIETHDNLLFVLYTYLKNNQNTTKAAQELFIHRNTLINKIGKIEEILGQCH